MFFIKYYVCDSTLTLNHLSPNSADVFDALSTIYDEVFLVFTIFAIMYLQR